jgi:Fe-S-cluster containining protein
VALITSDIINYLLTDSKSELVDLGELYTLLPLTRCGCKAHCCSMLPESTFLETLAVFDRLSRETDRQHQEILKRIVRYFFVNPAQISACPFLKEKRCTIYEDRFFGCRAYGLWSPQHYEQMARQNHRAKRSLSNQWQKLGIKLPDKVINFRLAYCLDVESVDGPVIDDGKLDRLATDIHMLSERLSPWHRTFSAMYYSDFSFLTTAMFFDIRRLLQMKVDIVRDFIVAGHSDILDKALLLFRDGAYKK